MTPEATYLTLVGVPSSSPPESGHPFFWRNSERVWKPNVGDLSAEIETICVQIHDALAARVFGGLPYYYTLLYTAPDFAEMAGLNSESPMSRLQFEEALRKNPDPKTLNQLLYLYDCRKLVASVQECTKEVVYLQGEFYRALNLDELFGPVPEPDGIRWVTSPVVTMIHATLGFVFIRLHSLLDYLAKLAHEVEHFQKDFGIYPRLASRNVTFGRRKHLTQFQSQETLFETCALVTEVALFRNHIIHAGFLDDMPKVYKTVHKGNTIEKFILMPDRGPEGQLEKFGNRNLFFGTEDRINLRLPRLLNEFQTRQVATLQQVLRVLKGERAAV